MSDLAKEKKEAIDAGWTAVNSLNEVWAALDSASNWGLLDIFGGWKFSGIAKYSKINDASRLAAKATYDVTRFQMEARDVFPMVDLNVDVNGLLTYLDLFHDSFLVDCLVQSRISEAKDRVSKAIDTVTELINKLENC